MYHASFSCLLLACLSCLGAAEPVPVNLLEGDTGFEAGGVGLPAVSCPWSLNGDEPRYWQSRGAVGFPGLVDIVGDDPAEGRACLALSWPVTDDDQWEAMAQCRTAVLAPGRHHLSLAAVGEVPTSLRITLCGQTREKRGAIGGGVVQVGTTWQRVGVEVEVPSAGRYVLVVALTGPGRVRLDALAVQAGAGGAYAAPLPLAMSLAPAEKPPTALPLLLFALPATGPELACTLRLAPLAPLTDPVALSLGIEEVDGTTRDVDLGTLPAAQATGERPVDVRLDAVGIWRLRVTARSAGQLVGDTGPVQVARIRPHQGRRDPFFGLHPHWDPLIPLLGAGRIRDGELLSWKHRQPTAGSWVEPPAGLLQAMLGSGECFQLILATTLGHMRQPWQLAAWGKESYADLPLWAASGRTTHGQAGEGLLPDPAALADYARRAVAQAQGLVGEFEVVNEAIHYMPAEAYVELLRTVYTAVKAADPTRRVVAGGSPPFWSTVASQPYAWYEEVFAAGALQWCDAWSVHTYDNGNVPEVGYDGRGEDGWLSGLLALMDRHGGRKPLLVSEKGLRAPTWGLHPKARAAGHTAAHEAPDARAEGAFLVRAHVSGRQAGIEAMIWFNRPSVQRLQARYLPWDGENYGLTGPEQSPKPTLVAYAAMTARLSFARPLRRLDLPESLRGYASDRAGTPVLVLWQWNRRENTPGFRPALARLLPPAGAGPLAVWDTWGRRMLVPPEGLPVGSDPIYVEAAGPVADADTWARTWDRAEVRGLPLAEVTGVRLVAGESAPQVRAGVLRLGTDPVTATLALAGETASVVLTEAARGTVAVPAQTPAGVGVLAATVDLHDGRPPQAFPLRVLRALPRADAVLAVDTAGQVVAYTDEFRVWSGPADCSAQLGAWWDAAALHLDIQVRDDVLWSNPDDARAWNGDGLEVFLDPDPAQVVGGLGRGANALHLLIPARPGLTAPLRSGRGNNCRTTLVAEAGGYRCTLTVPAELLGGKPLRAGMVLAFDLAVDDADTGQGRKLQMAWAGTADNYRDARGWGNLVLGPTP